ncbi:MAG: AsmA-like C-terminal region-containing protein, partial [bacterium]
ANVTVDGKVSDPDAMKSAGSLEFQGVTIATASSKNPIKNMSGVVSFNNQNVETKKLLMTIGKSDLALAFTIKNYLSLVSDKKGAPKPSANITLNSNHLYATDIMGEDKTAAGKSSGEGQSKAGTEPSGGKPAGKSEMKASVPLPNMDMTVNATIAMLTTEKLEMKNVRGVLRISNGAVVDLQNVTLNMYNGAIASKGNLDFKNLKRPTFNLNLDMKNLKANTALSTFTSFGQKLFGDLNMDVAISGALDDTMGLIPSSLNATGKTAVNNGRLSGVKVNEQIASLIHLPDVSEINFKDWVTAFSIKDGRVVIPDLKIAALGADYVINGSQGLDGSMDFKMVVLLSEAMSAKASVPGFAGEVLNALKEPNGRLKLDFNVGGSTDNPKVQLDTKALQVRATDFLKQKLDAETKKQTDDLKSKGTDLLKDLFKKKK